MAVTVTSDMVRALNATVKSVYAEFGQGTAQTWQTLATLVPSTQGSENYAWLGELPVLREFLDERVIQGLKEYGFTITNRTWEATIGVKRAALEDEQTGQLRLRIQQLAEAAQAHYDRLVFDLIAGGETGIAYDGDTFFSDGHGNVGSAALSADAVGEAIGAMMGTVHASGEPMAVRPSVLVVPPALWMKGGQILHSAFWPDATGAGAHARNPLQGMLDLVVAPRLATDTEWYLFDCTHPVKPFLLQQRIAPELEALEGESEGGFLRDEFLYGVRTRDNAGYGLWQYAYKSSGAG
ncbi:MAG TPA: Mu-like prophage major head subunit gpT family protein [Armatimonadaceae bacterium]|jgi:phage major head subunit gpT-like protein|nr:Mu-like prophage major head subunit gpT family protein [Armatimonadaceae bacterium]